MKRLLLASLLLAVLAVLGPRSSVLGSENHEQNREPNHEQNRGPRTEDRGRVAPLPFDHILRYDEFTKLLRSWADARPDIMQLESIGTTPEGRSLWFVTMTNKKNGAALEK